MSLHHLDSATKHVADITAMGIIVGVLAEWLPTIAALLTVIWTLTRLYEYARWVHRGRKPEEK